MKIIGLTGSIGMGKSSTAKHMEDMGIPVFDADKCVHNLLSPGGKIVGIVGKHFPESLKRKHGLEYIDRLVLGKIIFSNNIKRKLLEKIIHPEVNQIRKTWLCWAKRRRLKAVCFDVPLLFETGGDKNCDFIVVVSAPFFVQKQRVLKRKNMTELKFKNILQNQIKDKDKVKYADYVVKTGIGFRFSRNSIKYIISKELNAK